MNLRETGSNEWNIYEFKSNIFFFFHKDGQSIMLMAAMLTKKKAKYLYCWIWHGNTSQKTPSWCSFLSVNKKNQTEAWYLFKEMAN